LAAVPGRRRRPHRAAHGRQGAEPGASDVKYLSSALIEHYRERSDAGIDHYSQRCLRRVWKAERFSLVAHIADAPLPRHRRLSARSCRKPNWTTWSLRGAMSTALAENYVGLPL
jgi:p-hydroxybenzoate 3-monooxygenase